MKSGTQKILTECFMIMSRVEIFVPAYNGMHILPMFLDHYQERFPKCRINIFNDNSTDETGDYCRSRGCQVIDYDSEEPKSISVNNLRNNCWKDSEAEWIIVVDQDELINISLADLASIEDYDVIKFKGYNMVGTDSPDPRDFTYGQLHPWYCKSLMFRKSIGEINYTPGAHTVNPPGEVRWCRYHFTMFHYPKRLYSKDHFIQAYSLALPPDVADDLYDRETKKLTKLK